MWWVEGGGWKVVVEGGGKNVVVEVGGGGNDQTRSGGAMALKMPPINYGVAVKRGITDETDTP